MNADILHKDIAALADRLTTVESLLERISELLKPRDVVTRAKFDASMALSNWQRACELNRITN